MRRLIHDVDGYLGVSPEAMECLRFRLEIANKSCQSCQIKQPPAFEQHSNN